MKKDGGPAFPLATEQPPYYVNNGLSMRDWFAGQALIGAMTQTHCDGYGDPERLSKLAYKYADAMLAERRAV